MKILALFKEQGKDKSEDEKSQVEKGWDFTKNVLKSVINIFESDFDKKTILLLPQYVSSFDMGKGFEVCYDELKSTDKNTGNYGTKSLNMITTEDCLVKIGGKIVSFNTESYKTILEEIKGKGSVLNRQKITSDFLSYVMNQHVINELSRWALKYQLDETVGKNKKSKEEKIKEELTAVEEKAEAKEEGNYYEDELSAAEKPAYKTMRKSLLLVLFKETGADDKMTDEEKAEQKKEEKLEVPGTDNMSVGNYLENMLGTTHYMPIRYIFFPEVELSSYKESSTPEEKAEGDFIVVVKRPGDSEYPVMISDPISDAFDILGGLTGDIWDGVTNIWANKGGVDNKTGKMA